jgi:hypothetical protein
MLYRGCPRSGRHRLVQAVPLVAAAAIQHRPERPRLASARAAADQLHPGTVLGSRIAPRVKQSSSGAARGRSPCPASRSSARQAGPSAPARTRRTRLIALPARHGGRAVRLGPHPPRRGIRCSPTVAELEGEQEPEPVRRCAATIRPRSVGGPRTGDVGGDHLGRTSERLGEVARLYSVRSPSTQAQTWAPALENVRRGSRWPGRATTRSADSRTPRGGAPPDRRPAKRPGCRSGHAEFRWLPPRDTAHP